MSENNTVADKVKKITSNRYGPIIDRMQKLFSRLNRIFEDSERNCWTHTRQLAELKTGVFNSEQYQKIPRYCQAEIMGYLRAFRDIQDRKLVWCHSWDGQLFDSRQQPDGFSYTDPRFEEKKSAHCWRKSGGTFIPFN